MPGQPKVKGIVFQEPGKSTTTTTISSQQSQDNGKGILIELVEPIKKKDLIRLDEEVALKLQAEFYEEERLTREKAEKEQEANIALIETWDDIQAKIDVDHQLAERLQTQEQEELSIEEKATLFQQLLEKRRKHFATKRAEEKRNKPPTKAQQRKIMCTYLKNMEGYKLNDLKLKEFYSIQEMFDRAFKRVNTFEDFRTELVEGKKESRNRALVINTISVIVSTASTSVSTEVIVNGDSVHSGISSTGAEAILDEHLWKFQACKDANSLWEAIKNRFGGNKESKKIQKTILKQNYENFAALSQEGLDKTYDSLPSAWNNIALIMRNKSNLDTLSMDDLYNNLKVYESKIKGKSSSRLNSQNVAFVSSDNSSSTNETINTAHSVSAASFKDQASTASYVDDVMFSFFSNQSNASQLDYEI
ncbi:hypothetical protein Tco_1355430 [Tanacetum coccineum]